LPPESWCVLKLLFGGGAAAFGIGAALLSFWATWRDDEQDAIRKWFGAEWEAASESTWQELPERMIARFLDAMGGLKRYTLALANERSKLLEWPWLVLLVVAFLGNFGWWGLFGVAVLAAPLLAVWICGGLVRRYPRVVMTRRILHRAVVSVLLAGMVSFSLAHVCMPVLWLRIVMRVPILYGVLLMLVALPVFWLGLAVPIVGVLAWGQRTGTKPPACPQDSPLVFAIGTSASFAVTLIALVVGHAASPGAEVPKTFQMLGSNVLFDGVTLAFTVWVLEAALMRPSRSRLLGAVLLDMGVACLLACLSLYFGLAFSQHALSLGHVLRVLVGRATDGSGWEIGPYFWAMHTAFLPTLAYMALVLVAWLGQALFHIGRLFFRTASLHKNPLKLTAALFTLLAVISAALAAASRYAEGETRRRDGGHGTGQVLAFDISVSRRDAHTGRARPCRAPRRSLRAVHGETGSGEVLCVGGLGLHMSRPDPEERPRRDFGVSAERLPSAKTER